MTRENPDREAAPLSVPEGVRYFLFRKIFARRPCFCRAGASGGVPEGSAEGAAGRTPGYLSVTSISRDRLPGIRT